jgi:hypothetical protein
VTLQTEGKIMTEYLREFYLNINISNSLLIPGQSLSTSILALIEREEAQFRVLEALAKTPEINWTLSGSHYIWAHTKDAAIAARFGMVRFDRWWTNDDDDEPAAQPQT